MAWGVAAAVFANLCLLGFRSINKELAGDSQVLADNASKMLEGDFNSPYPLFLAIPALLSIPFANNTEIGVKLAPLFFAAVYIFGMLVLGRSLKFNNIQLAVLAVAASFPYLSPNVIALKTEVIATVFPLYIALYFVAISTRRIPVISVLFIFTLCLPFLHAQLTQAAFLFLIISAVLYIRSSYNRTLSLVLLAGLFCISVLWFREVNYLRIPAGYIMSNLHCWSAWSISVFLVHLSAIIDNYDLLITGGVLFCVSILSFIKNGMNTKLMILNFSMLVLAIFYLSYLFRAIDIYVWVGMRMRSFVYPVLVVNLVDLIFGWEGESGYVAD